MKDLLDLNNVLSYGKNKVHSLPKIWNSLVNNSLYPRAHESIKNLSRTELIA